jgi:hypothetical protein
MPRAVNVIWLVMVLGVLVLLGQTLGIYDVPMLHDFRLPLPFGQAPQRATQATPSAPSPTVPARPLSVSPAPVATNACTAVSPRFVQGMAALKAGVGAGMGEPLECERVVDEAGDTEQKTTTGLAYYRARSNISAFTNGWDHWALTPAGIVHWTGDDLDPPPGVEPTQSNE